MTARTFEQALAYARHGWPVFPCQPGGKEPATRHGFLDATTLMEALISRGVPMRSAHEAVGNLVRECEQRKCRLADLPDRGKTTTNPQIVTISHGKKNARLILRAGEALPKPDADSVEGRYGGIAHVVQKFLREK